MIIEQSVHISVGERIIYMYFFGMKILDSLKFLIDSFKYQSKKRGILKEVPGVPSLVSRRKMTLKLNYIYMKVL
jgi:hypothetical protein